ncbi:hypothetical protein [Pseudomonas anguilliseptica]
MSDQKPMKIQVKTNQLDQKKLEEINKVLADIVSGKIAPTLFSLHLKV